MFTRVSPSLVRSGYFLFPLAHVESGGLSDIIFPPLFVPFWPFDSFFNFLDLFYLADRTPPQKRFVPFDNSSDWLRAFCLSPPHLTEFDMMVFFCPPLRVFSPFPFLKIFSAHSSLPSFPSPPYFRNSPWRFSRTVLCF